MAQRLDERLVGNGNVLVARAEQHHAAVTVGVEGDLGGQSGLAHPGLTRQQNHPKCPLLGLLPGRLQCLPFPSPADEGQRPVHGKPGRKRWGSVGQGIPADLEDRHRLGQPFQLHRTEGLEAVTTPGASERSGQLGDEDLAAFGPGAQPGRLDHRTAKIIGFLVGRLAHGHADPHRQRVPHPAVLALNRLLHGHGARNGVAGRPESDHQPVSKVLHLGPRVLPDPFPEGGEVRLTQLLRSLRPQTGGHLRRPDQVGEEDDHEPRGSHGQRLMLRLLGPTAWRDDRAISREEGRLARPSRVDPASLSVGTRLSWSSHNP